MTGRWYEELYDDFPGYDDEPYVQSTAAEVDFVVRTLDRGCQARVLDVGCGTGRHALALAARGYWVVGLDLSEYMVRRGRAAALPYLDVPFLVGDARALPFAERFDAALMLCEGAFSLMERDAMDRLILRNLARVLWPGGQLIMTAPHAAYAFAHGLDEGDFNVVTLRERFEVQSTDREGQVRMLEATQRYYTCPELKRLLTCAGFRAVRFFSVTSDGFSDELMPSEDHFEIGAVGRLRS